MGKIIKIIATGCHVLRLNATNSIADVCSFFRPTFCVLDEV